MEADKFADFTLNDLRCFDAVVRAGGFQAAGRALYRSHPSVFAAVARFETRLGLTLFDRTGYRVTLTESGRAFHVRAADTLRDVDRLAGYAAQLERGEEAVLRVVLGDLCPRERILPVLSDFFARRDRTRLHLDYEAVGGPAERLREGTADIAFHRADRSDTGTEDIAIDEIRLIPVAAAGLLPVADDAAITPERLRAYTQCVIRDTARATVPEDHFLIDGAHRCTVPDHAMKRELILHGLGWGHLPEFLVAADLRERRLVDLTSRHLPGHVETLAAIRRRDRSPGPVAEALWAHVASAFG